MMYVQVCTPVASNQTLGNCFEGKATLHESDLATWLVFLLLDNTLAPAPNRIYQGSEMYAVKFVNTKRCTKPTKGWKVGRESDLHIECRDIR